MANQVGVCCLLFIVMSFLCDRWTVWQVDSDRDRSATAEVLVERQKQLEAASEEFLGAIMASAEDCPVYGLCA